MTKINNSLTSISGLTSGSIESSMTSVQSGESIAYKLASAVHSNPSVDTNASFKAGSRTVVTTLTPGSIVMRYTPRKPRVDMSGKTS